MGWGGGEVALIGSGKIVLWVLLCVCGSVIKREGVYIENGGGCDV